MGKLFCSTENLSKNISPNLTILTIQPNLTSGAKEFQYFTLTDYSRTHIFSTRGLEFTSLFFLVGTFQT